MKINRNARLSLITLLVFLVVAISVPVWAQQSNETNMNQAYSIDNTAIGTGGQVIDGNQNDVQGVGALAGLGIGNAAIGIGGQVIGGNHNDVQGVGAIAGLGVGNTAIGIGGQVIGGNRNEVSGVGAIAGGGAMNTAIGTGAQVIGNSQMPVSGIGAIAIGVNNTAVGIGIQVNGNEQTVAQGDQVASTSSSQIVQSGNTWVPGAQAIGSDNTAIGTGAIAYGYSNTAIGRESVAYGCDNTAIGRQSFAYGGNSVALGAGSVADQPNTVSVGSSGNERRITNVAPGISPTDGVNVSQLGSMASSIGTKIDRVGATAFALSALAPMAYDPNEPTQYSAGIGTYNGRQAIAMGLFHYTKPDVLVNAAIAMSDDGWEKSGRFGVTWKVGSKGKVKDAVSQENVKPVIATTTDEVDNGIMARVQRIIEGNNSSILDADTTVLVNTTPVVNPKEAA